ncbi:MAG TPA: HDOD domain-containing protein [Bdellovibrionota bacterium]|nr:HDOD domain-containing protein [Bdellovibrionota bacterium]
MSIKSVNDFYSEALLPLSPRPELVPLLKAIINCGETTRDFVWALRNDRDLQKWLRQTVVAMGFETQKLGLEQVITLIGQDKVRDILLGRAIEQAFVPESETLMARHYKGKKKPATSEDGGEEEGGEAPPIAEFASYLVYSKRAEEIANAIRNSYPWQAFVGGLLFDYLYYYLKSRKVESTEGLERADLKNSKNYLDAIFTEGLRSAIAATEVLQKISIKHQKNVFVTALLHNCGQPIQFGFDPLSFQSLMNDVDQRRGVGVSIDAPTLEAKYFTFDHAQIASLFIGRLPFLQEIDRVLDYVHSPRVLRMRDSNLYALHCVIKIGSDLAKLFQTERSKQSDIQKIDDKQIRDTEEFGFLKLNADEWKTIKSNFALKIMKASL